MSQPNLPTWEDLREQVHSQFRLGRNSAHDWDHWDRVESYGLYVGRSVEADLEVVRLFALLHDSQRFEESHDPEHGPRAARYAQLLCGKAFHLKPQQLELLMLACRDHEFGRTSSDPTIGSCWDADRLDLDRVGINTNPHYMSTDMGKRLALRLPYQRQQLAGIIKG